MTASELWKAAHRVETGPLARQSGIQDQIAAAYGGINYIEMDHYPQADVTPISLPRAFYRQLERQVSLIFVGERHRSSEVHERVIRRLEWTSGGAPRLSRLRRLAEQARDALLACDLRRFGDVMIENTDAQADLHPELVGERHRRIINVARRFGAWGWKVNGAGGEGGSVTILGQPRLEGRSETVRAILAEDPSFQLIPTSFSADGVRVTEQVPSAAAMR